jgi:hypothetical protein
VPGRQQAVEQIQGVLAGILKRVLIQAAVSRFPFLGLSFVNPIFGFFLGIIVDLAVKRGEILAFVAYVDFRTDQQGKDFLKAALNNEEAQKSGDPEKKKKAELDLIRISDKFISLRD